MEPTRVLFRNMRTYGSVPWVIDDAYLVAPYIRHEDLMALISRIEEVPYSEFLTYLESCKPKNVNLTYDTS
jgi:hypothetical protein